MCVFSEGVWGHWSSEKRRLTKLTSDNFTPSYGPFGRHAFSSILPRLSRYTACAHGSPFSATSMGQVLGLRPNACVVPSARTEELECTITV